MTLDAVIAIAAFTLLMVIVWSGVVSAISAFVGRKSDGVDERRERILLAFMLTPILIGAAAAAIETVSPKMTFKFAELSSVGVQAVAQAMQEAAAQQQAVDWKKWTSLLGVSVYAAGVAIFIGRLTFQTARLNRIAARADAANDDLGSDVAITSETIPAFASLSGRIVIPRELMANLSEHELSMIIDHERAHVRRGDTAAFLALSVVDALFWISPFIRRQTNRCRLAAEIACDAAVTQSAPDLRDDYARTLVTVLKRGAQEALPSAPSVFSLRSKGEHQIRIRQIMDSVAPLSERIGLALLFGLAAMLAPLAMFQVSIAQSTSLRTPDFSVVPIAGQMTAGFGDAVRRADGEEEVSKGVYIAAAPDTEVHAAADGLVVLVVPHPEGLGDFIMLDHGDGYVACYGPVKPSLVAKGDKVAAGQILARVDSSRPGVAPYLFIEVLKDGKPVDPASVMSLPAT